MCLGFQRQHGVDGVNLEKVAGAVVGRGELLNGGAVGKRHVVLVGREDMMRILLRGLLNHGEETALHLLAVDDEGAAENLVATMFAVDLGETEHLAIRQRSSELGFYLLQVVDFLGREGEALLFVVGGEVLDGLDGLGRDVDGEDVLVEGRVEALQHRVVVGVRAADSPVFLDAADAGDTHVLGDFDGIGAPGSNHLATRADVAAFGSCRAQTFGLAEQPAELADDGIGRLVRDFGGNNRLIVRTEEENHRCFD